VGQRPPNPTRDETDIVVIDDISPDTGPRIGTRTQVPVTRDLTIKPGIVPPGIDLDKVIVKKPDIMVLNPMLLRALMHQCQGND
jgi:hypothetical protein